VAYYATLSVGLWLGVRYLPAVRAAVSGSRLVGIGAGAGQLLDGQTPPVGAVDVVGTWGAAALAAISMFGALAIMIPVTWVYMTTRRIRGFDESVVHTLLILPVAITGVVMIVGNSVALAFSLAGIVAAVRFRTTLDDTKDAVYVFLAIGVGLATGVQALGIALVLSIVFNLVVLVLWWTRFGNAYVDGRGRAAALGIGDVIAGPASAASALQVGDPAILEAAAPADLAEIADRAVRVDRYLSEERAKKKAKRANTLLLVHADRAEAAQSFVDAVLEEMAVRFELMEIGPGPQGSLLEYIARLDGPAVQGAVADRLRGGADGAIVAAELRSLKGLKPRT